MLTKKISAEIAITSSGTTSVRKTSTSNGVRTFRFAFESASAAAVPNTVAISADAIAIWNERPIAEVIVSSSSARLNQRVEKPSNDAVLVPELNAKMTTTRIGTNRNDVDERAVAAEQRRARARAAARGRSPRAERRR